jgi:glucosamine kinase
MLGRGSTLRKRLEHRLKSAVPGAQLRTEQVIPARGAVRAALRVAGAAVV